MEREFGIQFTCVSVGKAQAPVRTMLLTSGCTDIYRANLLNTSNNASIYPSDGELSLK